jgi:NADH:ubiquinone oxidoreductase subunit E
MRDNHGRDGVLTGWEERADNLIPALQEIQSEFHYLPEEALRGVSRRFRIPLTRVFHVATFYNSFSLKPRGRNQVRVCLGTACHVRGSQRILDKVLRELNLTTGGTTSDFEFSVEPVRCLGCCALAPVMQVDHRTYGHLIQSRVPKVLKAYRQPVLAAA